MCNHGVGRDRFVATAQHVVNVVLRIGTNHKRARLHWIWICICICIWFWIGLHWLGHKPEVRLFGKKWRFYLRAAYLRAAYLRIIIIIQCQVHGQILEFGRRAMQKPMLNAKHVVGCDRSRIAHGVIEICVHDWHPELKLKPVRLLRRVFIKQCRESPQRAIVWLLFSAQEINVLHAEPSLHVGSFFADASAVQDGALPGVPCFIRARHADRAHVIVLHPFGSRHRPRIVNSFCNLKQPALIVREPHDALAPLRNHSIHVSQKFLMNRGFIINFNQGGQLFLHNVCLRCGGLHERVDSIYNCARPL